MRRILKYLGHEQEGSTVVNCDNNSAIELSKNSVLHGRSKHIDESFQFLRELTKDGAVKLVHCGTQDQIADLITKPLKLEDFQKFHRKLGVCTMTEMN